MDEAERILQTGNLARKFLNFTAKWSDNPELVRAVIYEQELTPQEMERIEEHLLLAGQAVQAVSLALLDIEARTSASLLKAAPELHLNRPALRLDYLGLVRDVVLALLDAIAAGEQQTQQDSSSSEDEPQ